MSAVITVSVIQQVRIARAANTSDASEVGAVVADIVQRDLLPATGIDWTTLSVSVADDPA